MVLRHRQVRRQLRRPGLRRQIAEVDAVGLAAQIEGERPARRRQGDDALRRRATAIGLRRGVEREAAVLERAARAHVTRLITGCRDARPLEAEGAVETVHEGRGRWCRGHSQIEIGSSGDVARLRRVLQQRRQVQPLDVDGALRREGRRLDVAGQLAANVPGLAAHVDRERQLVGRTGRLDGELWMQRVAARARHHTADLRHRHVPGRRQLDDRTREVVFDHAIDGQRALRRADRHLVDIQVVVTDRDLPGQLGQRELRRRRAGAQALDDDRVVDRLVAEGGFEIEIVDAGRQAISAGADLVVDHDLRVRDLDRRKRQRRARPLAIRFLLLLLHEPVEIPAVVGRARAG